MIKRARFASSIVGIKQIIVTPEKKIELAKLFSYMEGQAQENIK